MRLSVKTIPYTLKFKFLAGTSRGTLTEKVSYFVLIKSDSGEVGLGEAGPLKGLSPEYETIQLALDHVCSKIQDVDFPDTLNDALLFLYELVPSNLPSVRFAFESALMNLFSKGMKYLDNPFFDEGRAIPINGLIWMGDETFMLNQIEDKLNTGFRCLKMKIGAIDFQKELSILKSIRQRFSEGDLELRVDANGAFSPIDALDKLKQLSQFHIHSIEQPIKAGQIEDMALLCSKSPIAIALDEELISVCDITDKAKLLQQIKPQYVILKPTLLGGLKECREWIDLCVNNDVGWWVTSALESNVGLNVIAQFVSTFNSLVPQGLGTGRIYHNNVPSPLNLQGDNLVYKSGTSLWGCEWINENS